MEVAVNEVSEGLHLDYDEADQPKNTYRGSVNGEIFSPDGKKYHWKAKNGNLYSFSLIRSSMKPIQCWAILNRLYILSRDTLSTMSEIGYRNIDDVSNSVYFPIYYHEYLGFDLNYPIKIKGEKETENIERIYWRDGLNPPRVINLWDIINTSDQPYQTTLLADHRYLNVGLTTYSYDPGGGAVVDFLPGMDWTPSHDINVNPAQFKWVKYIPPEMLQWMPEAKAGILNFDSLIEGGLNYGSYFFTFRYGLNSGYVTPWQEVIGPMNVVDVDDGLLSEPQVTNLNNAYQNTQGKSHLISSSKGVRLVFTGLDTTYDYIQIAYIHCTGEEITEGAKICIKQEILRNTTVTIDVKYNFNFGLIPILDLVTKNIALLDIFDMCVLKSKMNIGNIKESAELPIDEKITGCTIRDELYSYPADIRGFPDSTDTEEALVSAVISKTSGKVTTIIPGQKYLVKGTAGQTVSYQGKTYQIGDIFMGQSVYVTFTGTGYVVPVIAIRKYYNRLTDACVYETHELQYAYDYKDPIMACYGRGYWGNQTYRLALMGFDERLNPMFCRYLDDHLTAERNINTTIARDMINKTPGADPQVIDMGYYSVEAGVDTYHCNNGNTRLLRKETHESDYYFVGQALSLAIDNLDLTDIIDRIHSFAIVRVIREKTIVSEGWLEPVVQTNGEEYYDFTANYRFRGSSIAYRKYNTVGAYLVQRTPKWYVLVDPEKLFRKNEAQTILPDDILVLKRYMKTIQYRNEVDENYMNMYRKYYDELATLPAGAQAINAETKVAYFANVDQDPEQKYYVDPTNPLAHFNNFNSISEQPIDRSSWPEPAYYCVGGRCSVVVVDNDGSVDKGFGYWPDTWPADGDDYQTAYIPIVQHKRKNNSDYGGTTKYALAAANYIWTNHFQKVDTAFKNAIAKIINGQTRYIVSGIQIFGGDCYINILDIKRSIIDFGLLYLRMQVLSQEYNPATHAYPKAFQYPSMTTGYSLGEALIVPLQSEMNLSLRLEKHIAKDRSYSLAFSNPIGDDIVVTAQPFANGIKWRNYDDLIIQYPQHEQYLYDDSYTSKHVDIKYPAYPEYLDRNNIWPARMRFSEKKTPGEIIDSYRIFKVENYRELNKLGGRITNLFAQGDRLYYFMDRLIGYIPVGERAMQSGQGGYAVVMGVGGEYERADDRDKFFGVQHMFGIVQVPDGFVWFDSIKKAWLHMDYDFGLTNESVIKGLDTKFNSLNDTITKKDNILNQSGVYLFYAPEENLVYGQFNDGTTNFLISYNTLLKKFITTFNWRVTGTVNLRQHTFAWSDAKDFYLQNRGPKRTWFGVKTYAEIEVICNQDNAIIKAFHCGEYMDAYHFFDQVTYKTDDTTIVEIVTNTNYKRLIGVKWRFSFPKYNRMRLNGSHLSMTFKASNAYYDDIAFHKLITKYVKWL